MAQYRVYEIEDKTTSTGKALKKLVLQGIGKQYPDKNVTMWADHPLFEEIAAGQTIDVELEIKDGAPNPKGGFYKNKTVLKPGQAMRAPQDALESRSMNAINLKVLPILEAIYGRLGLIMKAQGIKADESAYPKMDETNDAHTLDEMDLSDAPPF